MALLLNLRGLERFGAARRLHVVWSTHQGCRLRPMSASLNSQSLKRQLMWPASAT